MCIFSGFQYEILNKVYGDIQNTQSLVQKFVVVRAAPQSPTEIRALKNVSITTKRRNFGVGNQDRRTRRKPAARYDSLWELCLKSRSSTWHEVSTTTQ